MAKLINDQLLNLPMQALKAAAAVGTGAVLVVTSAMVVVGVGGAAVVQATLGGLATMAVWGAGKVGRLPNRSFKEAGSLVMPNFIRVKFNLDKSGREAEEIKDERVKPSNKAQSYALRKAKREVESNTEKAGFSDRTSLENTAHEEENSNGFKP